MKEPSEARLLRTDLCPSQIFIHPLVGSRRFPISRNPADNAALSFPHRGWFISPFAVAFASIGPSVVAAFLFNLRLRSLWDFTNAIMATSYAVVIAECATVSLKTFISGFRPYFLTVCDPDPAAVARGGEGHGGLYFSPEVCRQPDRRLLKQAMTSFPSGHAACAFAGLGVLFLYLNGKLKPWGNYRPMSWEVPVVVAPLVAALLISCSVLVTADHHAADVMMGAAIGAPSALITYRALFASVWDWRYNHIPLRPWEVQGFDMAGENVEGVMLHKGVWGGRVGRNFEGRRTGYWRKRTPAPDVVDGGRGEEMVDGIGGGSAGEGAAGPSRVVGDQMV